MEACPIASASVQPGVKARRARTAPAASAARAIMKEKSRMLPEVLGFRLGAAGWWS